MIRSMNMMNQAAVEALCSATYLENYLDCMESLPDDLQRSVSQLRELDAQCRELLTEMEHQHDIYKQEAGGDNPAKGRAFACLQRALIRCQEIGDEKLQLISNIIEHVENRTRQLEQDLENLDPSTGKEDNKLDEILNAVVHKRTIAETIEKTVEKPPCNKRQRRQKQHELVVIKEEEIKKEEKEKPKKKKKRKNKKEKEGGPHSPIETIDPDEPTYCLCEQISYGEMIGCDNESCPIEWFHFNCVGLVNKPKGKWYCPRCRGDKCTVKRADLK